MSDDDQAAGAAADAAEAHVSIEHDALCEYWVEQAQRMNTARYRNLGDHFRRDLQPPIPAWH